MEEVALSVSLLEGMKGVGDEEGDAACACAEV